MSKLEDKLSASIKNERNTTAKPKSSASATSAKAPAKTPAKASTPKAPAEKPAKANAPAKGAARKSGGSKLHPKRVWPD